jgi:hypothetical protein
MSAVDNYIMMMLRFKKHDNRNSELIVEKMAG